MDLLSYLFAIIFVFLFLCIQSFLNGQFFLFFGFRIFLYLFLSFFTLSNFRLPKLLKVCNFLYHFLFNHIFNLLDYFLQHFLFNKNFSLIRTQVNINVIGLNSQINEKYIFSVRVIFFVVRVKYFTNLLDWIDGPSIEKRVLKVFTELMILFRTSTIDRIENIPFYILTLAKNQAIF